MTVVCWVVQYVSSDDAVFFSSRGNDAKRQRAPQSYRQTEVETCVTVMLGPSSSALVSSSGCVNSSPPAEGAVVQLLSLHTSLLTLSHVNVRHIALVPLSFCSQTVGRVYSGSPLSDRGSMFGGIPSCPIHRHIPKVQ